MRGSTVICLAAATIAIAALAGCNAEKPAAAVQPEATTIAPAPPAHPEPDTSANPVERAAPPMLKPVALGSFEPGDPVAEAVTGKLAGLVASECMELVGGNGYIEEWPMARLLRDAQVLPIWEGTTNILMLDALRAARKERGHELLLDRIRAHSDTRALEDRIARADERSAREVVFALAQAYQRALLAESFATVP